MRLFFVLSTLLMVQELRADRTISYHIKGAVATQEKNRIAYLYIYSAGKKHPAQLLSVPIVNGRFEFSGSAQPDSLGLALGVLFFHTKPGLSQKEYMVLYQQGPKFKYRKVVLEKQVTVHVATTVDLAKVQGDYLNEQQNELQRIRQIEIEDYTNLSAWRDQQEKVLKGDKEAMVKLKADYFKGLRTNDDKKAKAYFNFIKTFPSSPFAWQHLKVFVMINQQSNGAYQEELENCIATLPAEVKERPTIKLLIAEINKKTIYVSTLATGTVIPEYSFTAAGGNRVSVKDFRGKYLLLDFWTSWCTPCRAEHYNMKQLYAKYKGRNFTILQVSMDEKEANWKKALGEDNLPWTQVRCLKGWDKEVETRYDIKDVPTTYLIDPDGKIIARNLRGEALTKQLAALLP